MRIKKQMLECAFCKAEKPREEMIRYRGIWKCASRCQFLKIQARLTKQQIEKLDELARAKGYNRSEMIRVAINRMVEKG